MNNHRFLLTQYVLRTVFIYIYYNYCTVFVQHSLFIYWQFNGKENFKYLKNLDLQSKIKYAFYIPMHAYL